MTKHNKDQPRDGNGKFAKMIKVEDKFGNAAYFTPEEMRGFKLPEKNPDCDPATKGYVKSLILKTREHTHHGTWDSNFTTLSIISGWLFTYICGLCVISNNNIVREIGDKYFIPLLLFSIAMTVVYYEFANLNYEEINECVPRELQKYTPPRKDECEEE